MFKADNCYTGHNFLAPRENLPIYSGHLLFNFQIFLFDTLLYFSNTPLTHLYLVSHQEFHRFPQLNVSQ